MSITSKRIPAIAWGRDVKTEGIEDVSFIIIILKKPAGKDRNRLNLLIILIDLRVKFARWFVKSIHYSNFIF